MNRATITIEQPLYDHWDDRLVVPIELKGSKEGKAKREVIRDSLIHAFEQIYQTDRVAVIFDDEEYWG